MKIQKIFLTIFVFGFIFGLQATNALPRVLEFKETRFVMGTPVDIVIKGEEKHLAREAARKAFREIEKVDGLMSSFKEQSEVSLLNREGATRPVEITKDTFAVLKTALYLSKISDGAFDITVAPLIKLWRAARKAKRLPLEEELQHALALVNYQNLLLDDAARTARLKEPGSGINLGGIAKGYAVDKAIESLRDSGIEQALVNAGGDLYLLGHPPSKDFWVVGIKHPRKPDKMLGTIKARDEAVVTSGNYEKYFTLGGKRYCHIIDPRTGMPVEGMLSVTVLAENTQLADGLATAIFVLGPEQGLTLALNTAGAEAVIVSEDDKGKMVILTTPGIRARLNLN